jgi:hypothetical protein
MVIIIKAALNIKKSNHIIIKKRGDAYYIEDEKTNK